MKLKNTSFIKKITKYLKDEWLQDFTVSENNLGDIQLIFPNTNKIELDEILQALKNKFKDNINRIRMYQNNINIRI
jgi:hypothetical protein